MIHRSAEKAFQNAIDKGYFSANPKHDNFAGRFMYMGSKDCGDEQAELIDAFKNIVTREYTHVAA